MTSPFKAVQFGSPEIARRLTATGMMVQLRDGTFACQQTSFHGSYGIQLRSNSPVVVCAQLEQLARRYRRKTFVFKGRTLHVSPFA